MQIVFQSVSKSFGTINALKDVSFDIPAGEFVFFVGPSGAGKSSILKLILSQYRPTLGKIFLDSHDLSAASKKDIEQLRRQIGVIFQDYQLISDKTVEENIALALDINNYPAASIPLQIEKVIEQVNLSSRRHLFPAQLSGGELQRAALARALAIEPKLILADEPTGNLDNENAWNLIKLFQEVNEAKGTTILMTTHNQDIVNSLKKRIITLKNGSIETEPTVIPITPPVDIKVSTKGRPSSKRKKMKKKTKTTTHDTP